MGIIQHQYTLDAFLRATLDDACPIAANSTQRTAFVEYGSATDHEWCGTSREARAGEASAAHVVRRLIRDGWPKGVELMRKVQGSVEVPAPVSIRRRGRWTDAGDDLDMQRVYAGDLDHAWRRTVRAHGRGPARVRILVDSIASAGVKADRMRWRGVAALVLADALIEAGYSVQVESVMVGHANAEEYRGSAIVKAYTDPLDLPALAATTAMPAFFRALWHAWHFVAAVEPIHSASYTPAAVQAHRFEDGDAGALVLVAGQDIGDAAGASAWVAAGVHALDAAQDVAAAA